MNYTCDVAICFERENLEKIKSALQGMIIYGNIYESELDKNVTIIEFPWIVWHEEKHPEIPNLMECLDEINAIFVLRGESLNDNEELYFNEADDLYEHLEIIRKISFKGKLISKGVKA